MTVYDIIEALDEQEVNREHLAPNVLSLEHGQILLAWWSNQIWWVDLPGRKILVEDLDHLRGLIRNLKQS